MQPPELNCTISSYATFLSALSFLVVMGFIWGHISQAPKKLFRMLNKMYIYVALPCMALLASTAIRIAQNKLDGWAGSERYVMDILFTDLVIKGIVWVVVVIGFVVIFRDRKILKTAALTAQFSIHGNDLGFSKTLLEAACKMELATNASTQHIDQVDFMSIEVPTNVMSFLIFLPLTSGLVAIEATGSTKSLFKTFFKSAARQMGKLTTAYLTLLIGVGLAFSTNSLGDKIVTKLYSFVAVIDLAQTMQTLMFGIFIYYIMMNFHDWEYLRPRKVFGITVIVTLVYPALFYCLHTVWFGSKNTVKLDPFITLAHASTPSSIYIQYYIMKHVKSPVNYIAAFILSTICGAILMYIFVIDEKVEEIFRISPLDYYVTNHQWEFVLTSIMLLALFAILVYLPRPGDDSKIRRIIFWNICFELLSNLILLAGGVYYGSNLAKDAINKSDALPMLISGMSMFDHIGATGMIVILYAYSEKISIVCRAWKWLIISVLILAASIPLALYTTTYLWFKLNTSYQYNYDNLYFFLDLRKVNITDKYVDYLQIDYPIGVVAYGVINASYIVLYAVIYVCVKRENIRRRVLARNAESGSDTTQLLGYDDDNEFRLSCKAMFFYQFLLEIFSIAFTLRNLLIAYLIIPETKDMHQIATPGEYILQYIELCCLIMSDLSGVFTTLIFCVSPGAEGMENVVDQFMYWPRKLQKLIRGCTVTETDIKNLSPYDLERCADFINRNKRELISQFREDGSTDKAEKFRGRTMIRYLIERGKADSQGEAIDFGHSYLRGKLITFTVPREDSFRFESDALYKINNVSELPNDEETGILEEIQL